MGVKLAGRKGCERGFLEDRPRGPRGCSAGERRLLDSGAFLRESLRMKVSAAAPIGLVVPREAAGAAHHEDRFIHGLRPLCRESEQLVIFRNRRQAGVFNDLCQREGNNAGGKHTTSLLPHLAICTTSACRRYAYDLSFRHHRAKYNSTRSVVQVATPAPKKSASSVQTGQPIAIAQASTGQSSASRTAIRWSACCCRPT